MIQVYATDERDFITEYKDFTNIQLTDVAIYARQLLILKQTNKVVIKKFKD